MRPSGHTDGARAAAPLLIVREVSEPGRVWEKRQGEANLLAAVSFLMVLCIIYISVSHGNEPRFRRGYYQSALRMRSRRHR